MADLFKSQLEYYKAHYLYSEGIFEWLTGSFVMGYFLVNYTDIIYAYIYNLLPISWGLRDYLAYLGFGLVLLPFGLAVTFVLTRIYKMFFGKNRRII